MKLNRIFFPLVAVGLMAMSCSAEFEHGVNDIDSWPLSGANYEPSLEHPGILHTQKDIDHIRQMVKEKQEPAYSVFQALEKEPLAQSSYTIKGPYEVIARDGNYGYTKRNAEQDFDAVYLNSVMWMITQDENYAKKSLELMLAYAEVLKDIDGNDTALMAGLEGIKIVYALEMLSHTYDKISETDIQKVNDMLRNVFLPVWEEIYNTDPYTNGNWGLHETKSYMAAAILWDDVDMYKKCVNFYLYGNDNGTISHYIDGDTGQCQESGRDQQHTVLGLGAVSAICELAWKQGNDLYSAYEYRALLGYEYTVKYNLGYDVPFETWTDVTGKYCNWDVISKETKDKNGGVDTERGNSWQPVFYMVYNHYVIRKKFSMPYTESLLETYTEDKYDGGHPSYGPLLFNDLK